ncbi:MAG TPA: hypothetical protein G4O16_05520 [Dehalococcoidia bacterium]|nr:hypothetical protein [Dehalococcoidia bacterium]
MGAFLLVKKPKDLDIKQVEKEYNNSLRVFDKKGLSCYHRIDTKDYVIWAFYKYKYKVDNVVSFDNNQFVIATGTLIYNRRMDHSVLKELFNDFSEDGKFLSKLHGEYCLIVSKDGKLYLVNDYLGLNRIYADKQKNVVSNSYLAVLKSIEKPTVSPQELYEYSLYGSFFGIQSLIKEIDLVDSRNIWQLYPEVSAIPRIPEVAQLDSRNFDEMVAKVSENLLDYFSIIKENFGDNVCLGLSAGWDSRLVLALLKKVGVKPLYLYTYPDSRQPTCVERTKIMARGEGLEIDYVDDGKPPEVSEDGFEAFIENQYFMNDGLIPVFNNGSTLDHRLKRVDKAKLQLNGGSGEIYRNFWRLPHRNIPVDGFVKSRYDIDFSMCTNRFDKNTHFSTFADKIRALLEITDNRLNEKQIAMLFPLWHARYWMGYDNTINNQISYGLTPFNEARIALQSLDIPLKYRNYGSFQASLIKYIDPDLAKYTSHYGYNFYAPLPIRARLKDYAKLHVPIWLKAFIRKNFWNVNDVKFQLSKKQFPLPYYLSTEYRKRIFSNSELMVAEYFDLDKIRDPELLSRVLSAELIISNRF